jgi:hypothetical protein
MNRHQRRKQRHEMRRVERAVRRVVASLRRTPFTLDCFHPWTVPRKANTQTDVSLTPGRG